MRIIPFVTVILTLAAVACQSPKSPGGNFQSFGKQIDTRDARPVAEVLTLMEGKDSLEGKFTGKVVECCQVKGCWMTMDMGKGEPMRVRFKDYGFFVPKNSGGRNAYLQGMAKRSVTSVEELKEYAKDEGKSEDEIGKITEPLVEIEFIAEGVLIEEADSAAATKESH